MSIEKIIYVTNGEHDYNGLTTAATSQLKKVVANVLEWDNEDKTKVFRTTSDTRLITGNTLSFLSNKVRKTIEDNWEKLFHNLHDFIRTPSDINEVMSSTRKWNIVVVGVTQKELQAVVTALKNNGYNVIDKDKIHHRTDIYTVTIDLNNKDNSNFFVAPWGE